MVCLLSAHEVLHAQCNPFIILMACLILTARITYPPMYCSPSSVLLTLQCIAHPPVCCTYLIQSDHTWSRIVFCVLCPCKPTVDDWFPGGVLPYQGVGGLGPDIKFRGKIWGKVQPSSSNKRKNLGSSVTTRRKNWERITILGAFGVLYEIQRAKFGVFVTYIFGGKIWGSY